MIREPAVTVTPSTERISLCSGCGALSPGWPDADKRTEDVTRPLFELRIGNMVNTLCNLCLTVTSDAAYPYRMSATEATAALESDTRVRAAAKAGR